MTHHYIRTAAAFAVFAFAGTVSAAVNNLGEIEMGKVYAFSRGDEVKGTYTAPETGMYKREFGITKALTSCPQSVVADQAIRSGRLIV